MQKVKICTILLLVMVGLALCLNPVLAQEETTSQEPRKEPAPKVPEVPEVSKPIIGGGGPSGGMLFLDLDLLNGKLKDHGYKPLNDLLFVTGGGGFGGQWENMRFGGMGFGGEISTSTTTAKGVHKAAKLSLGFGGFLIERGLYAHNRYSLTGGAVIGGGGADLTLLDHRSHTLDEAISDPPNVFLTRRFFGVQTYAGLELAILDWMILKVNVGYLWTFGGKWKQDKNTIEGPPKSFNSYLVQFMIAFGGRTGPQEGAEPEAQK